MKIPTLTRIISRTASAVVFLSAVSASAQDWQVVDTFEGGVPQGTWTQIGSPVVDTSNGFFDLRISDKAIGSSTAMVELPASYTSGKFTVAFDYYLPAGVFNNETGFGVASPSMLVKSSWSPIGADNRFQSVNDNPQNMAKVPEWTSDIFGTTEQGTWYNVWLVYDLSADPKTVTAVTKKASDPMEPSSLTSNTFNFADRGNGDDWSEITHFGFGIGLLPVIGEVQEKDDSLGALADNLYVSTGENITLKPTNVGPDWTKVDTFSGGGPEAAWTVAAALAPTFDDDSLTVTGTAANAGMYTALPIDSIRSSFTVTFDLLLPGGAGPNDIQFAVVGEGQIANSGSALFGDSDRFLTMPNTDPQPIRRFAEWNGNLLGTTVEDQWYHIWIVYDGSGKTMDFYSVPVSDPVESVTIPSEPAGSFGMLTNYTGLGYFVIGTAFFPNGHGVKIDNLYQAIGANVSLSPTAGDFGTGGGDPVSLWAALPDIGGGFKATGIGLLNDEHYPYVWHFATGGYLYIADEYSELNNIWGMDMTNDFWFWSDDSLGGWYFNVSNPSSGDMGWSAWTK